MFEHADDGGAAHKHMYSLCRQRGSEVVCVEGGVRAGVIQMRGRNDGKSVSGSQVM